MTEQVYTKFSHQKNKAENKAEQNSEQSNSVDVKKDSTTMLQELIRIDSQNPPGDESAVVNYIQEFCRSLHIDHEIYTYHENRANIVIRIGERGPENLVVLGHTDVVPAKKENWTHDPFSGEIIDGFMYGRGTLDMKYFIAVSLSVMRKLKEQEENLDRGITFVFTADEENGSSWGIKKLLEEDGIKEELSHKTVINEGGGFSIFHQGRYYYLFETGQKSVCRIRISIPEEKGNNPYFPTLSHEAALAEVLKRLEKLDLDTVIPKTSRLLKEAFSDTIPNSGNTSSRDPKLDILIETMSTSMITPTIIHGGSRNPNLPEGIKGTIDFDCRLLPGIGRNECLDKIEKALEDLPVSLAVQSFSEGYEADIDKNIIRLFKEALQKYDPQISGLLPFITPGSNDGKYLKPLGCDILGFAPLQKDDAFTEILPLIHGVDERISINSIPFCENILYEICTNYLIGDTYLG